MIRETTGARRGTPALFLDRDGVINIDRGYVYRIDQFEFVKGIFNLARFAVHDLAWLIVVATNQAGIGRGYFDESEFQRLTKWMCDRFQCEQAPIAKVYHCPYHPVHGQGAYKLDHAWRKPNPGMFLQAAADLNLDLSRSVVIGDKMSDIEAGTNAGVPLCIRFDAQMTPPSAGDPPYIVVRTLPEALSFLRARFISSRGGAGRGQAGLAGGTVDE